MRLLPLVCAAACLLPAGAAADPAAPDLRLPDASRHATNAPAPGLQWIGLFAEGRRFSVARDGSGLELQGGAYLQLFRRLMLRGGYRVFDYDGTEGDSSWETDQHGVLIDFSFSF